MSTIKLKRSAVSSSVPAVGDLAIGELAVNTYDGKLFMKINNGSESVVTLADMNHVTLDTTQTITGAKTFTTNMVLSNDSPAFRWSESDTNTSGRIVMAGGAAYLQAGASGSGPATSSGILRFAGYNNTDIAELGVRHGGAWQNIFHDNYHPNADTLTTARSISLTGDASGSVSFDGSTNVSISTTVSAAAGNLTVGGELYLQNGLRVGYNEATGGGSAAVIANASNGNRLYIAPTDKAGGYDFNKELTFDPDGDALWTAEGGFITTGNMYLKTGELIFNDTVGSVQKITHTSSSIYLHADAHIRFYESDGNVEQFTFDLNGGNLTITNDLQVNNDIAATGAITSSNRLVCHNNGNAPYTEQLRLGKNSTADRMFRSYLHDNGSGYQAQFLTWNQRHDNTNWYQGNWGGSNAIGFEAGYLRFYANDQVTGGAEDIITPTEVLELREVSAIFTPQVTMNGGAVISTNTWDDWGLRLNGNAPSIYFAQNDGSNAFFGMNGDNLYVLEDSNGDGAYGGSPYPFQLNVVDKTMTLGGNLVLQSTNKLYIGSYTIGAKTGDYGNIEVGDGAGWDGYSINGEAVFMCDGTALGLYDDTNNQWGFRYVFGGAAELRHTNSTKLATSSSGVTVTGNIDLTTNGGTILFGANDDYKIWDDGSNTYHRCVRHGGDVYFQGENSSGTLYTVFKIEDGSYLRAFYNGGERLRTESGGVRVYGDLVVDATTDFVQTREVRTQGGTQLVLAAGESSSSMSHTDMNSERVFAVAESGLRVISSPDNWGAAGWAGRYEANICDNNGESFFPGKITVDGPNDDFAAVFRKDLNTSDQGAVVMIACDADEQDDIAFEIRGNADGPSVDLTYGMNSNDTKFAVFGDGTTTIGYSNLTNNYTAPDTAKLAVNGVVHFKNNLYIGPDDLTSGTTNFAYIRGWRTGTGTAYARIEAENDGDTHTYNSKIEFFAGSGVGDTRIHFTSVGGTNGDTTYEMLFDSNGKLRPNADNVSDLGDSSNRWKTVYAATGTINTSDAETKTDIVDISETELLVAQKAKKLIKRYRFKDAVQERGDGARYHFGVIAQELAQAFEDHGLDPWAYGVMCKDVWWEAYVEGRREAFHIFEQAPEDAVRIERLGVRYDELFAFILAAL